MPRTKTWLARWRRSSVDVSSPGPDSPGRLEGAVTWAFSAVALPLTAYAIQSHFWPLVAPFAWFLFYPVVFLAPRLGGFSAGVVATVVSASLVWWSFIPEGGVLVKAEAKYWLSLGVFLAMGVAFSWFHARLRAAERTTAATLRDLREAERRKDEFLATVADAVVIVNDAGSIEYANARAAEIFGYDRQEMLGRPHQLLVPERLRVEHGRHVQGYFRSPRRRAMGVAAQELFGRRKDGGEFPIEVSLNPVASSKGVLVSTVVRDISERRRLEAAAQLHANRLAAAIESVPDLFWMHDQEGLLVGFNAAFARIWREVGVDLWVGMPSAELAAELPRLFAFEGERTHVAFLAERAAARVTGADSYEVGFIDGRTFRVNRRAMPDGGEVVIAFDLTEDLRRERQLKAARAAAEAANHAKSEFLASMSHELRTPMNAVLGFAQLLRRGKRDPLSDGQRQMVDRILGAGEHLLCLIDDVLDLARIEKQGVAVASEPVDLDRAIEEVARTLQPAASDAGVEICAEARSGATVLADRRRFVQMLLNLGSNAIKYNRRGGRVTYSVSSSPAGARVTVTDTGVGVPPAQRDKLFQPFHRAGQEAGPIAGTGIGLSITKRLAELMGGAVGYQGLPDGSAFWIELPSAGAADPELLAPPAQADRKSAPDTDALRGVALYVEDNPANVEFMRAVLAPVTGVELLTAPTAEAALEMVRARRPDLILMDLNLPGMSGLDALRVLRDRPQTAAIPVIAVSASASPDDQAEGLRAGFRAYLTKPLRLAQLTAALAAFLPGPARPPGDPAAGEAGADRAALAGPP